MVKHSDGIMICGSFSRNLGRGGLFFLPKNTTMNGNRYIKVLEDHLCDLYNIHQCNFFMQDSAPCHKAKKVMKWLEDRDIRILVWPGNSPDLNPIENCWNVMKSNLNSYNMPSVP
jgi:hypothetical protein